MAIRGNAVPYVGSWPAPTSPWPRRGCTNVPARRGSRTGERPASVTVVGRTLADADAYATATVAMGRRSLGWLAAQPDHEVAVICADRTCFVSAGLPVVESTLP